MGWEVVDKIVHSSGTILNISKWDNEYACVEAPSNGPYGWIQWKGTNVCMDIHCVCGAHQHFDGDFGYYFKMECCGTIYCVGQNVMLYEVPQHVVSDAVVNTIGDDDDDDD